MKKRLIFLAAAIALGGCYPNAATNNLAEPEPTPTPTPWLGEPICAGTITRGEWLVCDNKELNDLHRRLAAQWQGARTHASEERLIVLENQLYALLSERTACQDSACIAKAYRRYLDAPPPAAAPPVAAKPQPKPRPKPQRPRRGVVRDGLQDCSREIGWSEALALSRQCSAVTRDSGQCNPRRSCASLENRIDQGCRTSRRPPDFCPR